MKKYIFSKATASKQIIDEDYLYNDIIEPFISFDTLLELYYVNSYHRRAIQIKAALLSQIAESDLDKKMPPETNAKEFLYAFAINLEIFGNSFIEDTGDFYLLPTVEARITNDRKMIQRPRFTMADNPVEGFHLRYYSPASRFYGEPDYAAVLNQIMMEKSINEYNNAFFENGARPDMAILFEGAEPSEDQITAFTEFFETSFKGHLNAHKTLVISAPPDAGSTVTPKIKIEPLNHIEDMSFEKLKAVNRDEIISAHGIPPRLAGVVTAGQLGGGGELTGQLHVFNETVLKPKKKILTDFFQNIAGVNLELKELDVTSFKDDAGIVAGLVNTGIITPQEAKLMMGFK